MLLANIGANIYRHNITFRFVGFRDNDDAYVSVNGNTCWSKTNLLGTSGTQECGGGFKEEIFRVTDCYGVHKENAPLVVRVWTSLDADASEGSFAIDNLVVRNVGEGCLHFVHVLTYPAFLSLYMHSPYTATRFDNPRDFEGWNCGAITSCGQLGRICGGYNYKGTGSIITKTFYLPAGTYSVELDFIKIDSRFVLACVMK